METALASTEELKIDRLKLYSLRARYARLAHGLLTQPPSSHGTTT